MYGERYQAWKGWSTESFGTLSLVETRYLDAEIRKIRVSLNAKPHVLEIGFGNGSFLKYALERSWQISGIELDPDLVKRAIGLGITAKVASNLEGIQAESLDMVFAFDVMEHIPRDDLPTFIKDVYRSLLPGGIFFARFPNGDSAIGLPHQNGDLTHLTPIGKSTVFQLAAISGFDVLRVSGTAAPLNAGSVAYTLHRLFSNPYKAVTNFWKNLMYFPAAPVNFTSPNLVAVFSKPAD